MNEPAVYTVETARKVLEVIDAGLVRGLGVQKPGEMCVEAAICYALGLPHGDDPGCVEPAVRAFKIALNDKRWSSNASRATGLRALAVAQLGSKGVVDGRAFARRLAEQTIRQIVPIALRAAAQRNPLFAERLEAASLRCEQEGTKDAALEGKAAADAAYAAAADAAYAAAANAAYAAAAADAACANAACADAAAANAACADAAAANAACADAAADAADVDARRDGVLMLMAQIGLDVLREMHAPGVALWDAVNA